MGLALAAMAAPVLPSQPLGTPPAVPTGQGTYSFVLTQANGDPVTYDRCRPIEYAVADTLAPEGTGALLDAAIAEISAATGLVFEYVGEPRQETLFARLAEEFPTIDAPPVRIVWASADDVPELAGNILGSAGSSAFGTSKSDLRYVTGEVYLDALDLGLLMEGPDGPARAQATIVHELGHLVGLDHVGDPGELMFPTSEHGRVRLGPGDREGLALVGSGRCFGMRPLVSFDAVVEVVRAALP